MRTVCWNCRGLGNSSTVRFLGDFVAQHTPALVFLCETRLRNSSNSRIKASLGMNGCFTVDFGNGCNGLMLLWNNEINVNLLSYSATHIDATVDSPTGSFRFTGFHGYYTESMKHLNWSLFDRLRQASSLPWLIGGDFNELLCHSEKEGGRRKPRGLIDNFRDCLHRNDLFDCKPSSGWFTFTYTNGSHGAIRERLDRFVASPDWLSRHPFFSEVVITSGMTIVGLPSLRALIKCTWFGPSLLGQLLTNFLLLGELSGIGNIIVERALPNASASCRGISVVARDSSGQVLYGLARHLDNLSEAEFAEHAVTLAMIPRIQLDENPNLHITDSMKGHSTRSVTDFERETLLEDSGDLKVFDKMVVRKTEVQNVDVKDGEMMILECSRVPLVGAISSNSDDQTEDLIAPMKDGSLESSVSLHDTVKVTKTFYPLSVALPLVAKASTVVDVIASTAAKFTMHDIFRKVGITEPIRNYFIGNRNSNVVLNFVEHDKPNYWPKYLGNSQLIVTNVELSEQWTCNMNLKYGVPIGIQDRNGNLVLRGEPNWYMTVNLTQNVEYETIRDLFDPGGNSFVNVTVEMYLSVHSSFLTKVRRAFGNVWSNHLQKQKGGVDFVDEMQSSILKHMPRVTYDEVFIGCYWTLAIDIVFRIWHVYSRMMVQKEEEEEDGKRGVPICRCGQRAALVTAWTNENPSKRFFGCKNYRNEKVDCQFFAWYDAHFGSRAR
ncbi:hypothetical protein GQ457_09G020920 [Hibiscus cannabinus]